MNTWIARGRGTGTAPGTETDGDTSSEAASVAASVRACRRGRTGAFEPLVKHYGPRAFRFALHLVGDVEDAKDLSQDAFPRAFGALGRFDETRPFYPWFLKILRNLCYDHLRRRRPVVGLDPTPREHERREVGPELRLAVRETLEALSHDDREILVLRAFQGLSYAEIADVLDVPRGTVMSRLYHARRRFKQILDGRRS